MIASYAKHALTPTVNAIFGTSPNQIIYIGLSAVFSEKNWMDLIRDFDGSEGCKFNSSYGLAKFSSVETASKFLHEINSKSNLSVSFSKMKLLGDSGRSHYISNI